MRRPVRFLSVPALATSVAFAALVALSSCASESEGYPCSTENGNNDCNDGLVCEKPPNPSATNAPEVCCPQSLSQATTPECSLNGQVDAGNPAPPDGSTFPEAATTDGGHEATTSDAAGEASSSGDSSSSPGDAGPG
jgi:hypothetical protein